MDNITAKTKRLLDIVKGDRIQAKNDYTLQVINNDKIKKELYVYNEQTKFFTTLKYKAYLKCYEDAEVYLATN